MRAAPGAPEPGTWAVDRRDGRVGRVMAYFGAYGYLRPVGGGREWDCPPAELRPAEPSEVLRARVRVRNAEGRLP
ncbi:hypothetical protein [Streptomyces zhihengii]|uniref:Uncharacterized protein n=1 Tax=Streptomyces zhihengii TaxID=1818004 RepID=A0ABS2UTN5_9ACTN|nr:hypothetical protein [Streptomyces zhihengii]MBM9620839.1 hypothetical protein [Streptomyces zhihengii]